MALPLDIEQQRQEEAAITEAKAKSASQKTVDATAIEQSTPDNLKAKGATKLPQLIYILGSQVNTIIQPSINKLIDNYVVTYQSSGICPTSIELIALRQQRDLIVNQLNNIGNKIEILSNKLNYLLSL